MTMEMTTGMTTETAAVRIEEVLAEHPAVRGARLLELAGGGLVACVEVDPERLPPGEAVAAHLEQWRTLWGEAYGRGEPPRDPALNLAGWASSYTGKPIREAEMREWVERTVERLLDPPPRRVLEIGCGTGMLLLRVAGRCEEYVGLDFSEDALAWVQGRVEAAGWPHVRLLQRAADDLAGVGEGFDLAVLNSVIQYFPGLDYLLRVLAGAAAAAAPGGRIFLGDLRDLTLLEAFHTSVLLQQADAGLPLERLREQVEAAVAREEELAVDAALIGALPGLLPRVSHAEVQLKRGRARNELTRFRYDAVLHLEGGGGAPAAPERWLEWGDPEATPAGLRRLLAGSGPASLGVRRVPNGRLAAEMEAVRRLEAGGLATAGDLQEAVRRARPAGVEPEEYWSLERDLDYRVAVRGSGRGQEGFFDVVLRHRAREVAAAPEVPAMIRAAAPGPAGWTNAPLRRGGGNELIQELRKLLEERLPRELVPAELVLLPGN
jgi:SAM-dependent methyltransferase